MTNNFKAFLKLKTDKFRGKYVVFVKGKLFKAGINIEAILEDIKKKFPKEIPLVAKVPQSQTMIL